MSNKAKTKLITSGTFEGSYVFEFDNDVLKIVDELPAGIYKIIDVGGPFSTKLLYKTIERKEQYVDVSGGTVGAVLEKANDFFSDRVKSKYSDLGIAHKTGVILHGIPGTGKTVTSHIIMDKLVESHKALCIVISTDDKPQVWQQAIQDLVKLDRPIIIFVDECEQSLNYYETKWLTFLDGHESISNFMFLGCTNYIEKISNRIKRPSRIEHLIEVKSIEQSVAQEYVNSKLPNLSRELKAAMVHFAMEHNSTIDAFKNAIKEFYVYNESGTPNEFEKILISYLRLEEKDRAELAD